MGWVCEMKTWLTVFCAGALCVLLGSIVALPAYAAQAPDERRAGGSAQVVLIQAAPGMTTSISVDGRTVSRAAGSGTVLHAVRLTPGTHTVRFTPKSDAAAVTSTMKVRAGSSHDVVLHFPASPGGKPVLTSYATPRAPIGPGKARLLLAHTATVAPADVEFDHKTVFRNIANGEFAEADVPEGEHRVALLPTGLTSPTLLGPLEVRLPPKTVTMVYAVGTPKNGSMNVITHVVGLDADGSVVPTTIRTGSAGLAARVLVHPFAAGSPSR